jgi:flagellar protein FlgJ
MDTLLQDLLRKQQVQDMQKKRQEQVQRQQQMQQFISGLPPEQQSLAQMAPQDFVTQQIQSQFREPKQAPGVVGEFNAALQAGLIQPGTTLEQYVAMKKPPGTTVNVGGAVSPFEKKVQEGKAGMFLEIEKSGIAAQRSAQDVNRLDKLLSKVDTGGAAAFKQFAGNFGINTEGLDDIQAAQAIINKLVPAQRPPGSGPMSDADLELFKQSMPRIINQPGGNKLIIDGMKAINRYLIEEGKIAAEVTAGRITPDEGTRKMFALGNPVQDFFEQSQSATPQGVTVRRIN